MQMRHCVRGLIQSAVQLAISRIDTDCRPRRRRRRAAWPPRRRPRPTRLYFSSPDIRSVNVNALGNLCRCN